MPSSWIRAVIALAFVVVVGAGEDRPLVHPLFSAHAVLQRGLTLPVWGWAEPGAAVTVEIGGRSSEAIAGADGAWRTSIGPFEAGGPYELAVVVGARRHDAADLWFGDVWLCSGQSNMQWPVAQSAEAEAELSNASHPQIRLFTVPNRTSFEPQPLVTAEWRTCDRDSVAGFSAVGYFFGRHLLDEIKVPIGLINASWGGTIAEAWVSAAALAAHRDFAPALDALTQQVERLRTGTLDYPAQVEAWYRENDPGTTGAWQDQAIDATAWQAMDLPRHWPGDFDGVVWFRREIDLPASWAGRDLVLRLGAIDDRDRTWVNGVMVGSTDRHDQGRDYRVPGAAVKAGRNVIAIRVLDTGGPGGLWGEPGQLALELPGSGDAALPLTGPWSWRESVALRDAKTVLPLPPDDGNPNLVTVLSNAMIEPLVGFGLKGAIWYQGESNAGRAHQYRTLLPALIGDWRTRWGQGDFPFLIVQLANFTDPPVEPGPSEWAELREAQAITARDVPNCGLAVTIDVGEARDIHPRNKQDVGTRLALVARRIAYRQDVVSHGPVLTGSAVSADGASLRLTFACAPPLVARGGDRLVGFAVAGEDQRWAWADAVIDGESVVLSSPRVAKPVAARYAWATNPGGCNLSDASGLPASPFRTDEWPGVTVGRK
ncbi:MAG TPA: sialate O-acetylesterase [Planctomycetota bacterium]|nr:sialate O-acetylesterase [Planctomycetota bacterium]